VSAQYTSNAILASLSAETYERVSQQLEVRPLALEQVLYRPGSMIEAVYFPLSGVVSLLTLTEDGESIEAALFGRESVIGFWLALGISQIPWEAVVQGEGEALVMAADAFAALIREDAEFRECVLKAAGASFALATQSIACNRFHELPLRTARWLLLMHDRMQKDEFRITHQFMGIMLGVHRPAVTVALRTMSEAGIIEQTQRGLIRVLDRKALEDSACECYRRASGIPRTE
jgi:CRP-like cAMP-binding protein